MLGRTLSLAYGIAAYALFFVTFLYAPGFVGNFLAPKTMDGAVTMEFWPALGINLGLLAIFAVQHSVMARPWFKRWWTQFVPEQVERSTYVLLSTAALVLLFWQWRPMNGIIWQIADPVLKTMLFALLMTGWLMVLATTFLINHFDLFGLRQVWLHFKGLPYRPLRFTTPGPYKLVRHPLYVGWLLMFWATPVMSVAHLVFALGTTAYILAAIRWEEHDLADAYGARYAEYRKRVPMLFPLLFSHRKPMPRPATSQFGR